MSEVTSTPEITPARILIVDDESTIVELVSRMLSAQKHEVLGVYTGELALEAMKEQQPDVVLTDKNLSGISGIEVVRQGRKLLPDAEFIVMTGYASLDSAIEAIELGVFAYLIKPFTREQLTEHVNAAAAHVHKQREIADDIKRMRAREQRNITWPIAISQGLLDLGEDVHHLERLVSSLVLALPSEQALMRASRTYGYPDELRSLIERLSRLQKLLTR